MVHSTVNIHTHTITHTYTTCSSKVVCKVMNEYEFPNVIVFSFCRLFLCFPFCTIQSLYNLHGTAYNNNDNSCLFHSKLFLVGPLVVPSFPPNPAESRPIPNIITTPPTMLDPKMTILLAHSNIVSLLPDRLEDR